MYNVTPTLIVKNHPMCPVRIKSRVDGDIGVKEKGVCFGHKISLILMSIKRFRREEGTTLYRVTNLRTPKPQSTDISFDPRSRTVKDTGTFNVFEDTWTKESNILTLLFIYFTNRVTNMCHLRIDNTGVNLPL